MGLQDERDKRRHARTVTNIFPETLAGNYESLFPLFSISVHPISLAGLKSAITES